MRPAPDSRPPDRWYVIRHGQTDYNARNIVQGSGVDAPLDDTGRLQAERFFRHYSGVPFQSIFVSGLQRTYQTVEPFARQGIPVLRVPELNEISWGELEGRPGTANVRAVIHEAIRRWTEGELEHRIPGGESPLEVLDRVRLGLRRIEEAAPPGPVLICTHGRTLRVLLAHLLGYGLERMQQFEHDNTGLNLLAPSKSRTYALKINDLTHLRR